MLGLVLLSPPALAMVSLAQACSVVARRRVGYGIVGPVWDGVRGGLLDCWRREVGALIR